MTWILGAPAFATLAMTGLIRFVQVVHYPLFPDRFVAYSESHQRLTTLVVAPLMLVELATAAAIVFLRPPGIPAWLAVAGLALVLALWASTAFVQVPCHQRLLAGFDPEVHARLVGTNWIRTVLWTVRGALAVAMIWSFTVARPG